jgi:hypothetical protein
MLRLEPHLVMSNRTAVPLQLMQSRLELEPQPGGPAGRTSDTGGRPGGAVVAEGGASFTQASRGANAAVEASGGESA